MGLIFGLLLQTQDSFYLTSSLMSSFGNLITSTVLSTTLSCLFLYLYVGLCWFSCLVYSQVGAFFSSKYDDYTNSGKTSNTIRLTLQVGWSQLWCTEIPSMCGLKFQPGAQEVIFFPHHVQQFQFRNLNTNYNLFPVTNSILGKK